MKKKLILLCTVAFAAQGAAAADARVSLGSAKRAIEAEVRKDYRSRSENGVRVHGCKRQGSARFRCRFDMINGPQYARYSGRARAERRSGRWRVSISGVRRAR